VGRRLVLRGVPPQMQRLLVATRLHRILAIEGGLEAESLPRV
ncbi:anti-anti-sigma factor, partial [Streptomyces sp. PRKS01-29]|nr:anti-anti-sigma factor [Streptomyces sabulosicollis]